MEQQEAEEDHQASSDHCCLLRFLCTCQPVRSRQHCCSLIMDRTGRILMVPSWPIMGSTAMSWQITPGQMRPMGPVSPPVSQGVHRTQLQQRQMSQLSQAASM